MSPARALPCCLAVACGAPAARPVTPSPLCQHLRWWNAPPSIPESSSPNDTGGYATEWDQDFIVPSGTPVQLPGAALLLAQQAYVWGWQPTFLDLATGHVYRFLHLRPQDAWTTDVGALYPAGAAVGLSGGDTLDTGLGQDCAGRPCSTGAHLCVQADAHVASLFPPGGPDCPAPATPGDGSP